MPDHFIVYVFLGSPIALFAAGLYAVSVIHSALSAGERTGE